LNSSQLRATPSSLTSSGAPGGTAAVPYEPTDVGEVGDCDVALYPGECERTLPCHFDGVAAVAWSSSSAVSKRPRA